jgi:hypothetical protein
MASKLSIVIERNESGYLVSFPESATQQFQDQSLETIIAKLKDTLSQELTSTQSSQPLTTGQSLLKLVQNFTADMTEEELNQLPVDAATQHNHYLYGSEKTNP